MSFGINGPDNNMPAIQKPQSAMNNGGGDGNLGYFKQKKKKKDEKDERDVLELSGSKKKEELEDEELDISLDAIGSQIKNLWSKLKGNKTSDSQENNNKAEDINKKEKPEE